MMSTKMNMWISDLGALCHITNDDSGMYDVTDINELVEDSSGSMPITKEANLAWQ